MKQHLRLGVSTVLVGMLFSMASCEKEPVVTQDGLAANSGHGFLHFNNAEALKQAVQQLANTKAKSTKLEELRRSSGLMSTVGKFRSLNEVKDSLRSNAVFSRNSNGSSGVLARGTSTDPTEVFDELVPDISFASVLNEDLQVQVGDDIYQITPEGTYYTNILNKNALAAMLADSTADLSDHSDEIKQDDYLYLVTDDIYRYDTYAEAEKNLADLEPVTLGGSDPAPPNPPDDPLYPVSTCAVTQPSSSVPTELPSGAYCTFPTYGYGSKTIVGGWIGGMFGVNTDRTNNFDNSNRIKVKLYNFNYMVYSSIGLKVKFQKKGWTGIWDKKDCDKLVLGWDAIIFEVPQVYSRPIPYNISAFPNGPVGRVIGNELFKFINFEVSANVISQLDQTLLGANLYSSTDVENRMKGAINDKLGDIAKSVWTYAENQLAPDQVSFRSSVTKGFRMIYPDKFVMALSRWERAKENDGEIDCLFDFNTCRLTYNGSGQGDLNFGSNVLAPTYSNRSYSYTLKKASVYGAGLYRGQWKGIRILQE
jgi:hypothetical protein